MPNFRQPDEENGLSSKKKIPDPTCYLLFAGLLSKEEVPPTLDA